SFITPDASSPHNLWNTPNLQSWLRAYAPGPYNEVSTFSSKHKGHQMSTTGAGLEGVIAGESEICYIDGYAGVLSYRGYNIHTLAEHARFEEVVYLLWKGTL